MAVMRIYLLLPFLVMIIQPSSASLSTAWAAYSGTLWRFFNLKIKNKFEEGNKVVIQQDMEDPSIEIKETTSKKNKIPLSFIKKNKYSIIQKHEDTEEHRNARIEKLLERIIKYRKGKIVNMKRFFPLNVLLSNKLSS